MKRISGEPGCSRPRKFLAMTASLNSQATVLPDEYQDWLTSTINRFPTPGPNVARRLVDILGPETSIATVTVPNAA